MPIHQTKLMMSIPQPTGMLMPHTPTPLNSSIDDREQQSLQQQEADREPEEPAERRLQPQDDVADLLGDALQRVARREDRDLGRRDRELLSVDLSGHVSFADRLSPIAYRAYRLSRMLTPVTAVTPTP